MSIKQSFITVNISDNIITLTPSNNVSCRRVVANHNNLKHYLTTLTTSEYECVISKPLENENVKNDTFPSFWAIPTPSWVLSFQTTWLKWPAAERRVSDWSFYLVMQKYWFASFWTADSPGPNCKLAQSQSNWRNNTVSRICWVLSEK